MTIVNYAGRLRWTLQQFHIFVSLSFKYWGEEVWFS